MLKTVESVMKFPNTYYIRWTLSQSCNFSCSYCITRDKRTSEIDRDPADDLSLIVDIINKVKERKVLKMIGGEPCLFPLDEYLAYFDKHITNQNISYKIHTNGSATIDYWKTVRASTTKDIQIIISEHDEMWESGRFEQRVKDLKEIFGDDFVKIQSFKTNDLERNKDRTFVPFDTIVQDSKIKCIPDIYNWKSELVKAEGFDLNPNGMYCSLPMHNVDIFLGAIQSPCYFKKVLEWEYPSEPKICRFNHCPLVRPLNLDINYERCKENVIFKE